MDLADALEGVDLEVPGAACTAGRVDPITGAPVRELPDTDIFLIS